MPTSTPPTTVSDVIGVFVLLGSLIFSPEVAQVVGPYLAVFTASVVGGAFALERREKTSRTSALWFFFRVTGASILLTSIVAAQIVGVHPSISERAALVPVAFLIGIIGDDYRAVLDFLVEKGGGLLQLFKGGKKND